MDDSNNNTIYQMKTIQQRLANTIGRAPNVFVSGLIDDAFNDPRGKACKIKVLVDTPFQREGLRQTLKNEYMVDQDKLQIDIQTIEENEFNVPPNTAAEYLRMALDSNPLISRVEDNNFKDQTDTQAFLYVLPVAIQYSSTTGDHNPHEISAPVGTYIAAGEFQKVLRDDVDVASMPIQS